MSFARQIDEQRYREQTERQASMPGVMSQRMTDMFAHEVRDAYEMTAQQADLLEGVK